MRAQAVDRETSLVMAATGKMPLTVTPTVKEYVCMQMLVAV